MTQDYFNPATYLVIDRVTGDEVPFAIFIEEATQGGWEKVYVKTLCEYLDIGGAGISSVLVYLLRNKDKNNIVHGTLREIEKNCSASYRTIAKTFSILQKNGFMKKIRSGSYMLTPKMIRYGKDTHGAMLLRIWGKS